MRRMRVCSSFTIVAGILVAATALAQDPDQSPPDLEINRAAFKQLDIGNNRVFFHQRMLNGAIVEKDFILYRFDRATNQLLDKREHWRPDLAV